MVYTVGVLCSFIIYILLGLYLSRRVNTSEDYYVSGRNGSTFMVTGTLVASFLSTVSFMGEVGFSYEGYPILLLILIFSMPAVTSSVCFCSDAICVAAAH